MPSFQDLLTTRSAAEYAAFLLPHLKKGMSLLDCGCGPGSITVGLAERLHDGAVVGLDVAEDFRAAREFAQEQRISDLTFMLGDVHALPFADGTFDAVLAHSMIETLATPAAALAEAHRVMKAGGVIGVAAVDYGGVLLAGPSAETLEHFYQLKEAYWLRVAKAEPRRGRHLRSLLIDAGFRDIEASARYVSYGSGALVRRFGEERAQECEGPAFAEGVIGLGLTDRTALRNMAATWRAWGRSSAAFLAFPWCNAVGWK